MTTDQTTQYPTPSDEQEQVFNEILRLQAQRRRGDMDGADRLPELEAKHEGLRSEYQARTNTWNAAQPTPKVRQMSSYGTDLEAEGRRDHHHPQSATTHDRCPHCGGPNSVHGRSCDTCSGDE